MDLLKSPKLKEGDLVRLVSPASFPNQQLIDKYVQCLNSWGLRCDLGKHILDQHGYMAGTDADRLSDLNDAFRDPEVRAVITTRGGAGAYRVADDLDFDAIRSDPKPLLGFSDITSLHLSLQYHCNLGALHGCLFGDRAQQSAKQLLMTTEPILIERVASTFTDAIQFPGLASGPLIGGNLQMLATSVGVHLPNLKGAILFLEYHVHGLGTVDRYLTQLIRSGALDGIVGVALGSFEAARNHVDRSWTMIDVLQDRLGSLNVPVLGGVYAGHDFPGEDGDTDQYTIPLGSHATMNANAGTLLIEPVVK